jgi:hypothetical protein
VLKKYAKRIVVYELIMGCCKTNINTINMPIYIQLNQLIILCLR